MSFQKSESVHNIDFQPYCFIKKSLPKLMLVEVEKTQRAFKIARECGLFRVPEVLDFDYNTGVAKFERIFNIKSIRSVLKDNDSNNRLIGRIGESLAVIHNELSLPSNMIVPIPKKWSGPEKSNVFIHGDFNLMNIHCNVDTNEIWILDWQMTGLFGGRATFGSRYYDIAWFLQTVFHYLANRLTSPRSKDFLIRYFKVSNYPYNEAELKVYIQNVMKNYIKGTSILKNPRRYFLHQLSLLYFNLFIKSFSLKKF